MLERTLKRFEVAIFGEAFCVVAHGILMRSMCLDLSLVVFPQIVLLKVSEQIGFADGTDVVIGFIFCVEDEHILNGCSNKLDSIVTADDHKLPCSIFSFSSSFGVLCWCTP